MKSLRPVLLLAFLGLATAQVIIHPTWRPPPRPNKPILIRARRDTEPLWINHGDIPKAPSSADHPFLPHRIDDIKLDPNRRYARSAEDQEPLWLNQGDIPKAPSTADHPFLPSIIDDIHLDPNRRYVRSVDSPSAKRGGGGSRPSSGSRDTGATHPGYNRRNARDIRIPDFLPGRPEPSPFDPSPRRPWLPVYVDGRGHDRVVRDVKITGFPQIKKPTHRDVIIPNWNPNVKTNPWDSLGGNKRH